MTPWAGEFGNEYTKRQVLSQWSRRMMWDRVLRLTPQPQSVIEFGANEGQNLQVLRELLPTAHLAGVEINEDAYKKLKTVANLCFHGSMLDFSSDGKWDMTITRGVLIHIEPVELLRAYDVLYQTSNRFICIAEYYSPHPRMIRYQGHDHRLWARDFAGEMLDRYEQLRLVNYGFVYHRDPAYPQDDVTWFLMEKTP